MKRGKVFLVGAGPGDPELITIKGLKLLRVADTIIYDHLISPKLLNLAPTKAEKIYVGKQDSHHTMQQEEINSLLVKKAKSGRTVVRLKGGDPFVLGRGAEEVLYLVQNRIRFEVVPGVSSAIAAPAYAGIPVTHRDHASSFLVVTGHRKTSVTKITVDWKNIAKHKGTLVLLMGIHNLEEIVKQLTLNGKRTKTPISLVQWATWNRQRTVTGTLANIVTKVRKADLKPPAVIIVGDIVRLQRKMEWFR